jgi:hypothetical protein
MTGKIGDINQYTREAHLARTRLLLTPPIFQSSLATSGFMLESPLLSRCSPLRAGGDLPVEKSRDEEEYIGHATYGARRIDT